MKEGLNIQLNANMHTWFKKKQKKQFENVCILHL